MNKTTTLLAAAAMLLAAGCSSNDDAPDAAAPSEASTPDAEETPTPTETAEEPADDDADPVLRSVLEETGGDADAFADLLEEVVRFQAGLSVDLSLMAEAGELADFCTGVDADSVEVAAAQYEADYETEGGKWTSAHEAGAAKTITTFCENQ